MRKNLDAQHRCLPSLGYRFMTRVGMAAATVGLVAVLAKMYLSGSATEAGHSCENDAAELGNGAISLSPSAMTFLRNTRLGDIYQAGGALAISDKISQVKESLAGLGIRSIENTLLYTPSLIQYAPSGIIQGSPRLMKLALKKNPELLQNLPANTTKNYPEFARVALEKNFDLIRYVPEAVIINDPVLVTQVLIDHFRQVQLGQTGSLSVAEGVVLLDKIESAYPNLVQFSGTSGVFFDFCERKIKDGSNWVHFLLQFSKTHPSLANFFLERLVEGKPWLIKKIPVEFLKDHPHFVENFIRKTDAFESLPSEVLDPKMFEFALETCASDAQVETICRRLPGDMIRAFPRLAKIAVHKDPRFLKRIPLDVIDRHPELIEIGAARPADKHFNELIIKVWKEAKIPPYPHLGEAAVRGNFRMLGYFLRRPLEFSEMIQKSPWLTELRDAKKEIEGLASLSEELIEPKIVEKLQHTIRNNLQLFNSIPSKLRTLLVTPEISEAMVTNNPAILESNGWLISFLRDSFLTEAWALFAVLLNPNNLEFLPERLRTFQIYQRAVRAHSHDRDAILDRWVPKELREVVNAQLTEGYNPWDELLPNNQLPQELQRFIDNYIGERGINNHIGEGGFTKISSGSAKDVYIHPDLTQYVFKVSHNRAGFAPDHCKKVMRGEATTMRQLQNLIKEQNLSLLRVPKTYLVDVLDAQILIQEKMDVDPVLVKNPYYIGDNRAVRTSYEEDLDLLRKPHQEQFTQLLEQMDQRHYGQISSLEKFAPKSLIVDLVQRLLYLKAPYTLWEKQLLERAWVWDLHPITAHNVGSIVPSLKDQGLSQPWQLAIVDAAL